MNQEGRAMLFRVEIRCAEEWGKAIARHPEDPGPYRLWREPFGVDALYQAWRIVKDLKNGKVIPPKFANGGKQWTHT